MVTSLPFSLVTMTVAHFFSTMRSHFAQVILPFTVTSLPSWPVAPESMMNDRLSAAKPTRYARMGISLQGSLSSRFDAIIIDTTEKILHNFARDDKKANGVEAVGCM